MQPFSGFWKLQRVDIQDIEHHETKLSFEMTTFVRVEMKSKMQQGMK